MTNPGTYAEPFIHHNRLPGHLGLIHQLRVHFYNTRQVTLQWVKPFHHHHD